jgi:hypothetical protein
VVGPFVVLFVMWWLFACPGVVVVRVVYLKISSVKPENRKKIPGSRRALTFDVVILVVADVE